MNIDGTIIGGGDWQERKRYTLTLKLIADSCVSYPEIVSPATM